MDISDKTHIAILPDHGAGHYTPISKLVRNLLSINPSIFITFILIPTNETSTTISPILSSLPSASVDFITLPHPPFSIPFPDFKTEAFTRILRSANLSLDALTTILRDMRNDRNLSTLVVDMFTTDAIQVALELGIKPYLFFPSSAMALSMFLHLPYLKETIPLEEWNPEKEVYIHGTTGRVRVKDLPDPVLDRNSVFSEWFTEHTKRFRSVSGIILNSFDVLENGPLNAMRVPQTGIPAIYCVGPLVINERNQYCGTKGPPECLKWLDEQPYGSVLYVSFGSNGTLSTSQVTELALGLELSNQRFLWVVNAPNDSVSFGRYYDSFDGKEPLGFLPKGFLERTKGRGFVVLSWAPQIDILSHGSTGGFLTHCGWNSIMESVVHGVGLIAWPIFGDQRLNAIELVDDVKVALRVDVGSDGLASRTVIAKTVRALMEGQEGKEIRRRMKKLRDEAVKSAGRDGSSKVILTEVNRLWKTQGKVSN